MAKQESKMDMQAMMEVYKKVGTPGAPHKLLASLEGSWTTKTKSWMEPGKPAVEMTGMCEQKLLLGGRYLQQVYTGDMMGEPFTGINLIGYDNHTRKYVSTWIDSMSTGIYFFEGTASADGKTITQESSYDDPVVELLVILCDLTGQPADRSKRGKISVVIPDALIVGLVLDLTQAGFTLFSGLRPCRRTVAPSFARSIATFLPSPSVDPVIKIV